MFDVKLFTKNEKELETLIQTIRIYSQDIRREIGIEKCAIQISENEKKFGKIIFGERENYSKPNYIAGILSER